MAADSSKRDTDCSHFHPTLQKEALLLPLNQPFHLLISSSLNTQILHIPEEFYSGSHYASPLFPAVTCRDFLFWDGASRILTYFRWPLLLLVCTLALMTSPKHSPLELEKVRLNEVSQKKDKYWISSFIWGAWRIKAEERDNAQWLRYCQQGGGCRGGHDGWWCRKGTGNQGYWWGRYAHTTGGWGTAVHEHKTLLMLL